MTAALRESMNPESSRDVSVRAPFASRIATSIGSTSRRETSVRTTLLRGMSGPAAASSPAGQGPGLSGLRLARSRVIQRDLGNRAMQRQVERSVGPTAMIQRDMSLSDVIPDAILQPIRSLLGESDGFAAGVTQKSDAAADGARAEAAATANVAETGVDTKVTDARSQGEAASTQGASQAVSTEAAAKQNQSAGESQADQIENATPAAEYATDPVKSAVTAPPPGTLPGVGKPAPAAAATEAWNCDESWIVSRVSSAGAKAAQAVTRAAGAVLPDQVMQFAQGGIARMQAAANGIRQKVEGARKYVGQWLDDKLKPARDLAGKVQRLVADKFDGAKKAVTDKVAQLGQWASAKWNALKTGVSNAVDGAVKWARRGASGIVDRAKDLAGRFWSMVPESIKGPLTGVAKAIAAPVALAYKAAESAVTYIEEKAGSIRKKLLAAADSVTKWLADKYQKVRAQLVKAGDFLSKAVDRVRKKASDVGKAVYADIDQLTGGRLSKWRAAAAARFGQLKGKVCAATGDMAGPCVERFVPEPTGANGKSFATLATKAEITVPVEGVPIKVAAGAKITIERTSATYKLVLSGDGFAGVAFKSGQGGGSQSGSAGGGGTGSVTVDGTFSEKALALFSLSNQGPPVPAIPIPIGGKPASTPPAGGSTPQAAKPGAAAPPGAGAQGAAASFEVGRKVGVALTYTFDVGADKSTCDGLGGLTALLASQGGAALLPEPFSAMAAMGGQAAFADKLTSAKVTVTDTASGSVSGSMGAGASGSASVSVQRGASLESKTLDDKARSKVLTATLFQGVAGEAAASFAPGGIGLSKIGGSLGGKQELTINYNITLDAVSASFKQALSGSVTLGAFAGAINGLPGPVRDAIRRRMACVPDATEAVVAFELSQNVANLQTLAAALDKELNRGSGASAAGVWDAVSDFLQNKDNSFTEFSAILTFTEKVLGVKASGSADGISGSAEATVTRGSQIVLCPPVRIQASSPGASAAAVASAATLPGKDAVCDDAELIRRFGNRRRDLGLDPDTDPQSEPRIDDVPLIDTFKSYYNRVDSWDLYIRSKNPELAGEFQTEFSLEEKRAEWTKQLKERTTRFKDEFRDVNNTDPTKARQDYEDYVLGDIQQDIEKTNRSIAVWYLAKIGSTASVEEIIEEVHGAGTELWRAAWRAAIVQVNGVLAEVWPPAKDRLQAWVGEQRNLRPDLDLTGDIGELDYIGSLATGFKGPPKQQIRFNPEKFDVDANLPAPPLAKYAMAVDARTPDRKRVFGRHTSIEPLIKFSDEAHAQLGARAKGYDKSDPFDVALDAPELPVQERGRVATERLYRLRDKLDAASYRRMVEELKSGGYLDPTATKVRDDLTEVQSKEMNAIMDRYGSA